MQIYVNEMTGATGYVFLFFFLYSIFFFFNFFVIRKLVVIQLRTAWYQSAHSNANFNGSFIFFFLRNSCLNWFGFELYYHRFDFYESN